MHELCRKICSKMNTRDSAPIANKVMMSYCILRKVQQVCVCVCGNSTRESNMSLCNLTKIEQSIFFLSVIQLRAVLQSSHWGAALQPHSSCCANLALKGPGRFKNRLYLHFF